MYIHSLVEFSTSLSMNDVLWVLVDKVKQKTQSWMQVVPLKVTNYLPKHVQSRCENAQVRHNWTYVLQDRCDAQHSARDYDQTIARYQQQSKIGFTYGERLKNNEQYKATPVCFLCLLALFVTCLIFRSLNWKLVCLGPIEKHALRTQAKIIKATIR